MMGIYDDEMRQILKTIKEADEKAMAVLDPFFRDRRDSLDQKKLLEFTIREPVQWETEDGEKCTGVVEGRNKRTLSVRPDGETDTVNMKPDKVTSQLRDEKEDDEDSDVSEEEGSDA